MPKVLRVGATPNRTNCNGVTQTPNANDDVERAERLLEAGTAILRGSPRPFFEQCSCLTAPACGPTRAHGGQDDAQKRNVFGNSVTRLRRAPVRGSRVADAPPGRRLMATLPGHVQLPVSLATIPRTGGCLLRGASRVWGRVLQQSLELTSSSFAACFSALRSAFSMASAIVLLSNDDQGGLPSVDGVSELLHVRARHAFPQVTTHPTHRRPNGGADDDGRREDDADEGSGRCSAPGPMSGGGPSLLTWPAVGVLGDHRKRRRFPQLLPRGVLHDLVVGSGQPLHSGRCRRRQTRGSDLAMTLSPFFLCAHWGDRLAQLCFVSTKGQAAPFLLSQIHTQVGELSSPVTGFT